MRRFHPARAELDHVFHAALAPPEAAARRLQRQRFRLKRPQTAQAGFGAREALLDLPSLPGKGREDRRHGKQQNDHDEGHGGSGAARMKHVDFGRHRALVEHSFHLGGRLVINTASDQSRRHAGQRARPARTLTRQGHGLRQFDHDTAAADFSHEAFELAILDVEIAPEARDVGFENSQPLLGLSESYGQKADDAEGDHH